VRKLLVAALAVGAAIAPAAAGGESDRPLTLSIKLPGERFIRGAQEPVEGLVATLTVTNTSSVIAASFPCPKMDPLGNVQFEIYLLGAPAGVPKAADTPEKTLIKRSPGLQPVGDRADHPPVSLAPGESKEFALDVGRWYDIKAAGKYEMTCLFQDVRSNTVAFEVLPLKRVDVPSDLLVSRLGDYERGWPDFPFMFYITRGPGWFDMIVFLTREGKGGAEHYELHRLGEISPGHAPEMAVDGARVGLIVPDKRNAAVSWRYLVDFAARPVAVKGEKIVHEPNERPALSLSGEATPAAAE